MLFTNGCRFIGFILLRGSIPVGLSQVEPFPIVSGITQLHPDRAGWTDPATATPDPSPTSTPTAPPITGWEYAYYTYDSSRPHAVATIERGEGPDNFGHDAIGDMTSREDGSDTWTQDFSEEGRLEALDDGTDDWTFTYDGDVVRVLQENPDGTKTVFLGGRAI